MNSLMAKVFYGFRLVFQPALDLLNDVRLKNSDFTIISSTCAGGIIYHRCRRKFLSPTVNLYFSEIDLQKMAANLDHYMKADLVFLADNEKKEKWPMAMLDDILIGFNHAKSPDEARLLWNKRRTRVNYSNIWLLSSDRGLSYDQIKSFGDLPAKGRVMFTAKEYPEFDYCLCLKYCKGRNDVGEYMLDHTPIMDHFKWEQEFNYVKWLNTGIVNELPQSR